MHGQRFTLEAKLEIPLEITRDNQKKRMDRQIKQSRIQLDHIYFICFLCVQLVQVNVVYCLTQLVSLKTNKYANKYPNYVVHIYFAKPHPEFAICA